MRNASYPATGMVSSVEVARSKRLPKRRSLFASLFDALHESRRLQAELIVGRYRHLIDRTQQRAAAQLAATKGRSDGSE